MKKAIIAVADDAYLNHAKSLFGALKTVGRWNGDLILVANNIPDDKLDSRTMAMVSVLHIPATDAFHAKFYAFSSFVKEWDRVMYMDVDMVICKDVNPVLDGPGTFMADGEPFCIHQYMDNVEPQFGQLKEDVDVDAKGFNTSCMVYDTEIIDGNDKTVQQLFGLQQKYAAINHHTGLPSGTDQPIINMVFQKYWTQIPNICFHEAKNEDTVAFHTCRWMAPWKRHKNYYNEGLKMFNEIRIV